MIDLRIKSFGQYLEEKFGGKWKYNSSSAQWDKDDGSAYVCNVLTGRDMDGEYTGETSRCMYFTDGRLPQWVYP